MRGAAAFGAVKIKIGVCDIEAMSPPMPPTARGGVTKVVRRSDGWRCRERLFRPSGKRRFFLQRSTESHRALKVKNRWCGRRLALSARKDDVTVRPKHSGDAERNNGPSEHEHTQHLLDFGGFWGILAER
jgi:hypothetical protein